MRVSGHDVIRAVAAYFELRIPDFSSNARYRRVARPRQVAMYLMRQHCHHLSLPAIGRLLGNRDHTTILHGERVIAKLIQTDPDMARDVIALSGSLTVVPEPIPVAPLAMPFDALCNGYAAVMRRAA